MVTLANRPRPVGFCYMCGTRTHCFEDEVPFPGCECYDAQAATDHLTDAPNSELQAQSSNLQAPTSKLRAPTCSLQTRFSATAYHPSPSSTLQILCSNLSSNFLAPNCERHVPSSDLKSRSGNTRLRNSSCPCPQVLALPSLFVRAQMTDDVVNDEDL